jgi:hypothetical protein
LSETYLACKNEAGKFEQERDGEYSISSVRATAKAAIQDQRNAAVNNVPTHEGPGYPADIEQGRQVGRIRLDEPVLLAEVEGEPKKECVSRQLDEEVARAKIEEPRDGSSL